MTPAALLKRVARLTSALEAELDPFKVQRPIDPAALSAQMFKIAEESGEELGTVMQKFINELSLSEVYQMLDWTREVLGLEKNNRVLSCNPREGIQQLSDAGTNGA